MESQFRCNGLDGYLAGFDNALQIRETANETLETRAQDQVPEPTDAESQRFHAIPTSFDLLCS
ncbi:MAG: hypothetical protein ACI831_001112 [Candidatus Azotimanducaceae bacterium]